MTAGLLAAGVAGGLVVGTYDMWVRRLLVVVRVWLRALAVLSHWGLLQPHPGAHTAHWVGIAVELEDTQSFQAVPPGGVV